MSWIDASVDEFCRGMGLDAVDFSAAGRVQLSFEQSGTLHIEKHHDRLFLMLARALSWYQSGERIQHALLLCHAEQGWPFEMKTGLLDDETLVFSAKIEGDEVTLPTLEQAFALLVRLHDEVAS
ncbi:type III secretion chaperone SycN [Vibrio parahaemolyticus]|uniref:type III secretion chaperone SycN n=1 Tax=Vibrio parahaemolyticus TaxID=670 RepID=UPI00040ACBBB|nr:type III secretion chaperone SycN [Vibrio parahaemolyticus]EJE4554981.1 type III secretion chaperone SycN [Vibrio parahaemolyticus]HCH0378580.1 type III secretion chaperone SycN [Vibrio parahaemolyticus]HCH1505269.1 type III secretion chaperone SycN [Vibrio parahaemolyticus]HCH4862962.1 type III secretion chaperone SycN [Vibrio parahaemolyticus]HCH4867293.1 type III secretion chaperone SycN [Vibrio parahaemolyticus]